MQPFLFCLLPNITRHLDPEAHTFKLAYHPLGWVLGPCQLFYFPQADLSGNFLPTRPGSLCMHACMRAWARTHTHTHSLSPLAASLATKISSISGLHPQHACPGFSLAPSHLRYCVSDATCCLPDATAFPKTRGILRHQSGWGEEGGIAPIFLLACLKNPDTQEPSLPTAPFLPIYNFKMS